MKKILPVWGFQPGFSGWQANISLNRLRHRRTLTCYNSNRLHMLWCTNTNNLLEYLVITLWLICDYIPLILFCFIKNIFEHILYKVLYKNTLWILIKSSSSGHSVLHWKYLRACLAQTRAPSVRSDV